VIAIKPLILLGLSKKCCKNTRTKTGYQFWYNGYQSGCPVSFCKSPFLQGFYYTI